MATPFLSWGYPFLVIGQFSCGLFWKCRQSALCLDVSDRCPGVGGILWKSVQKPSVISWNTCQERDSPLMDDDNPQYIEGIVIQLQGSRHLIQGFPCHHFPSRTSTDYADHAWSQWERFIVYSLFTSLSPFGLPGDIESWSTVDDWIW